MKLTLTEKQLRLYPKRIRVTTENKKGTSFIRILTGCFLLLLELTSYLPVTAQSKTGGLLDKKISVKFDDVTLAQAFQTIEEQVNCTFVYSNKLLNTNRKVSGKFSNKKMGEVLHSLLGETAESVKVDGNQIFIRPVAPRSKGKASISGKVVSSKSGEPVIGASVVIKGIGTGTTVDTTGRYILEGLNEGTYSIEVSSVGYGTLQQTITIKEGQKQKLEITLSEDGRLLNDVVVVGKTEITEIKESGFNVSALDVNKFNNSAKDLNQVLNTTTGVRIRETGGLGSNFSFSINGLSGKAVRFFIDGIPMENYGMGMTFNNIPVNLADRLEVFKGVVPVELGADALGGAVNIVTNKGAKSYLDASYSYGSFNTHRASLNTQYLNKKTGFLAKITGFYNYSANDYLMRSNPRYNAPIRGLDSEGKFVEKNVRRFNDQYESAMIQGEVGVINKKWADIAMVSMLYNNHYKEVQTGATQNIVYGKVNRRGDYFMPSIRYKKDNIINGLSATAFLSYGIDKFAVTDTSSTTYWWDGAVASSGNSYGEFGTGTAKSRVHYENKFLMSRVNLEYTINDHNTLIFNHNFNSANRESYDELDGETGEPSRLTKMIYGLAWKSTAFKNRLTNTVFAKYFQFGVAMQTTTFPAGGSLTITQDNRHYDKYGYGLASRFALIKNIGIRLSYEHAYRLPEQIEILGDGINIISNPEIKPESSHNLNIGTDFTYHYGKQKYALDISGFVRDAKDFIYSVAWGNYFSRYLNEGKVVITGAEAEFQYKYGSLLEVTVNGSFQKSKQNQRYQYGSKIKYATYGNMIPNQPWMFGNLFFSIGKNEWLGKGSRLQFDWSSQYIHWFYLDWEAYGSAQSSNKIPIQFLQNAGLTASLNEGKYNISLESRNLGNQLAYDNFRLQKPGRSFNVKLRYYIR